MTDATAVARRVAGLRAELRTAPSHALTRALDDLGRALDRIRQSCPDDEELALRLSSPRALAASYVRATMHLTEAGVDPSLCESVLREGQDRVGRELAAVERRLGRPGRRTGLRAEHAVR